MRVLLAALLIFCAAAPARAADIEIAFTDDQVAVDTGFAGVRLTLFGAVTGVEAPAATTDIVSVIEGPAATFKIRRMEKSNLIWTPGRARLIENAPGLFHIYATRAVDDIAPLPMQAAYRLEADLLGFTVNQSLSENSGANQETEETTRFRRAFLTQAQALGLYRARAAGVEYKKGALFTIDVDLPANTPVGDYAVSVFLFRDGELLGSDTASLTVNKVGVERRIFELAHNRPVSYGVFCVALSLFAGWIAAFAFRK